MAAAQDCPKCGLVNPPDAQRCDCGWDFVTRSHEQSYLEPTHRKAAAIGIGFGVILLLFVIRVFFRVLKMAANGQ